MKKLDAYLTGTAIGSACTAVAFSAWQGLTAGFFAGLGYFLFCCLVGPMLVVRAKNRGEFESMTPREWFWWPFTLISQAPLFLACLAIVHDWQADHPVWRYVGIGALFVAAVLAMLLLIWLMGRPDEKA